MIADRAHRQHGPPAGALPVSDFLRGGGRPAFEAGGRPGEQPEPDGRLRQLALRRLLNLVENAGELPPDGSSGVLLPPLSERFLGDELGCKPAMAGALLASLVQEGLLVETEGPRYRIPDPKALRGEFA